jgi:NADP-dependent 3-hydroxy acid dehydrogenase YdfG
MASSEIAATVHANVFGISFSRGCLVSEHQGCPKVPLDDTFNVNVRGTLFTVQKALPLMRDGGSIIMTGSIASAKGFRGLSVYNASKAAIRNSLLRPWL